MRKPTVQGNHRGSVGLDQAARRDGATGGSFQTDAFADNGTALRDDPAELKAGSRL